MSLVGGSTLPRPGGISLAHYDALFLAKLPLRKWPCMDGTDF
ncbi:ATP-binding protein [Janthinobacterium lividum]